MKAPNHLWILFDLSNGDKYKGFYCWQFTTRAKAREYMAKDRGPNCARLAGPVKYIKGEA